MCYKGGNTPFELPEDLTMLSDKSLNVLYLRMQHRLDLAEGKAGFSYQRYKESSIIKRRWHVQVIEKELKARNDIRTQQSLFTQYPSIHSDRLYKDILLSNTAKRGQFIQTTFELIMRDLALQLCEAIKSDFPDIK